ARHDRHGVIRAEPELARVVAVLEQVARAGTPQPPPDRDAREASRDPFPQAAVDPQMPEPGRREHEIVRSATPRREAAEHDHAQRDAMHDVGPLLAHDAGNAEEAAQRLERAEAAPLVFERNDPTTLRRDALAMLTHARRHHDLEARRAGGTRHRQEVGDEKPVLGDEIKKLGHPARPIDEAARFSLKIPLWRPEGRWRSSRRPPRYGACSAWCSRSRGRPAPG